jgi:hypothetical protein
MAKRIWIKLSVDRLLNEIAWKEANGYDFEAATLKSLFVMTKQEMALYHTYLKSCKAAKKRREEGYPDTKG